MAVDRPLNVLNLYDVLTDFVPGVTVIGALAVLFRVETLATPNLGTLLAGIAVGGYVVGHLLQSARSRIWGTPDLFQRVASSLHAGAEETPLGTVSDVEAAFLDHCRERFNLGEDFEDWSQLFRLVVSELETQPERRALRFQALHSFYWSMAVASAAIALLAGGAGVMAVGTDNGLVRSPGIAAGVLVASLVVAVVFELRRRAFQRHFVRYLITDIHVAMTRDG